MSFLWGCMLLTVKVALGSLCWSLIIAIPIIILGALAAWIRN